MANTSLHAAKDAKNDELYPELYPVFSRIAIRKKVGENDG